MKSLLCLVFLISISFFFNCSSTTVSSYKYKLQKESPLKFHKIEIQKWKIRNQINASGFVSSAQRSSTKRGSGIRMYLIMPSDITTKLDSVYYGNFKTNIYQGINRNAYFADFVINKNEINSSPFALEDNECVVSYTENGKIKYYKYSSVKDKS